MHVISSVFVVVNWLLFSFRVFSALDTGGMSFLFPVIGQLSWPLLVIGHESWRTLVNVQAQLADQTVFRLQNVWRSLILRTREHIRVFFCRFTVSLRFFKYSIMEWLDLPMVWNRLWFEIHGLNWLISKVLGWSAKCDYPPRKSCLLDFNFRRLF